LGHDPPHTKDPDSQLARALAESLKDFEGFDPEAACKDQSKRECDEHADLKAVIGDRDKLRQILGRLPGVDPSNQCFDQFFLS
jgi:hypothetical protein